MSISEDIIKKQIVDYSNEAGDLSQKLIDLDAQRQAIELKITQIAGAIAALNRLLDESSKQKLNVSAPEVTD